MPFKSKAQARYMYANHPEIAKEFESKTKSIKSLPERKSAMKKKAPKLVKGAKAKSKKGFAENIKREEKLGKSKKRAVGTAYGEAYLGIDKLEKKAAKRKRKDKK